MPAQEPGTRPARALPYELEAEARVNHVQGAVELVLHNHGEAGAVFHVRAGDGDEVPRSYTVGPRRALRDSFGVKSGSGYDLAVHGPNGFFRACRGSLQKDAVALEVRARYEVRSAHGRAMRCGIRLELRNEGAADCEVRIRNAYTQRTETLTLTRRHIEKRQWALDATSGWYDLLVETDADTQFQRHFAGHLETGFDSTSDPAMGQSSEA